MSWRGWGKVYTRVDVEGVPKLVQSIRYNDYISGYEVAYFNSSKTRVLPEAVGIFHLPNLRLDAETFLKVEKIAEDYWFRAVFATRFKGPSGVLG